MGKADYSALFGALFQTIPVGQRVALSDVIGDARFASVSSATIKTRLREYIEKNPGALERITGLIPKPETVIELVESKIGFITEDKLDLANIACSDVINGITRPMVGSFVRENLSNCYDIDSGKYTVQETRLSQFLLEDFAVYLKAAGNGLASIAGSLNEKLLQRAMVNSGMNPGEHFKMTGTDSEADIVVHTIAGSRENLGVEVKSYHARERLLRGLKDVKEPKVGAGYFKDPSEFNRGRTITLLQAHPAAIYMPQRTLSQVEPLAREVKTTEKVAFGSVLYRPLERFATDMRHYHLTGTLPQFSG
jgi:hypothetical protein